MKLTFIGAGGARTPLVIQSILDFQERLPLTRVCLMDIDAERLELMRMASKPRLAGRASFEVEWTTDPRRAIEGADFIVTTFRAGLMESRVVDEQVPLRYGVLGQETTGPGGFAMALRTIPVMLKYVEMIRELAPGAWLLNFTNPAGMVTEAITRVAGYERAVGICDNPAAMVREAAATLGVKPQDLFAEYFGLNHLGWMRAIYLHGKDRLPEMIRALKASGERIHGIPFDADFIETLGALPNEYNLFYYYPRDTVERLLKAGQSRALQILPFNQELYAGLRRIRDEEADPSSVEAVYARYLHQRGSTYMTLETGEASHEAKTFRRNVFAGQEETPHLVTASRDGIPLKGHPAGRMTGGGGVSTAGNGAGARIASAAEGYTGVTLGVMEALTSGAPSTAILNVPNRGVIPDMAGDDVVEATCFVGHGVIRPLAMGQLPDHALGLMKSVKAYERLTIQAAVEGSYALALKALALHPLVPSYDIAKAILDEYVVEHREYFPVLR